MNRLANKVAVITGGNSGIGLATAQAFVAEGAQVIITGRSEEAINEAVAKLGPKAEGIISDAGQLSDIQHLKTAVAALTDRVDILFINAGIGKFAPFSDMPVALFDEIMDINFKGAYFSLQALLPLLSDGASVILNTSVNAHVGMSGASAYAASKAALLTVARNVSAELVERRIRINSISPGPIETPIYSKLGLPAEALEGMAGQIQNQIPIGRFGTADEIAQTAVFLASDESTFIVGTELLVDGGVHWKFV
jgi:NAD(P)-dependent dehydrogenase (short-subunit alcohol dehydrogenase family)